jgi:hypothetical protein
VSASLPKATLATIPTLDELAKHPDRAAGLPAPVLQGLLCQLTTVQATLLGCLLLAGTPTLKAEDVEPDRLLDVGAAAQRLRTTKDWLYRHARELPFTVRNGRQLRFSGRGIARYIREREGLT